VPGSKKIEYRSLSNWLATGTCWAAIALRSAWIADWLIVSLKTHTFGPNVAEAASGHRLAGGLAATTAAVAGATAAALAGTAAVSAPPVRAGCRQARGRGSGNGGTGAGQ
jgi:hypothetical protein